MQVFTIIFRVIASDVFEMPVESWSYEEALASALDFFGLTEDAVIICRT